MKKTIFLLSTSLGSTGGSTNLKYLIYSLPYYGAINGASYSLLSFSDYFNPIKIAGDYLGQLQECTGECIEVINE